MNLKIAGSIVVVVIVTVALLFVINMNKEKVDLFGDTAAGQKSEAFLRCERLVEDINLETDCEKKWSLFGQEFQDCGTFPPNEPTEANPDTGTFRDVIFKIGDCFVAEHRNEKAIEVFDRGLQFDDWMKDDNFNTYSAHFLLNREKALLTPTKNPKCFDLKGFETQLKNFATSGDAELVHELLYSDDSLDTQVMGSDAGGFLTYQQWKEVYDDNKSQYQLKYAKPAGAQCFIISGWEKDYPWRAFCAEKMGAKGCYFLKNIYAGIEATLDDFEEYKKKEEAH